MVWQAVAEWSTGRLDLSGYVRMRVRHALQNLTNRRHIRAIAVDTEFWAGLEEYRQGRPGCCAERAAAAAERAAIVVGSMAGADLDVLVGALVDGPPGPGSSEAERHRFARAVRAAAAAAAELDAE